MSLYLTVYASDDLPTSEAEITSKSLGTVDACSELDYTHALHGAGSIKVSIPRSHTQAALLQQDRYVIVHSDVGVVGGAFLEAGDVQLTSEDEEGGEIVTWTGRGQLKYTENGVLPTVTRQVGGEDPDQGTWEWWKQGLSIGATADSLGAMYRRAVLEVHDDVPSGVPVLTHDFDFDSDSAGTGWDTSGPVIDSRIGDNLLTATADFDRFGLFIQMEPTFLLHAYRTYGRDLTGAAFGTGVVRFEAGANIAAAIGRKIQDAVTVTHLLVGGQDYTYQTVVDPDWSAGDPVRWGYLDAPETDDADTMTTLGLANIAARKRQSDVFAFPLHTHGDDAANGIYEPGWPGTTGAHFWVGDSITMHTGSGTYDVDDLTYPISAITWHLLTGDAANGDYQVIIEIGANYSWDSNGQVGVDAGTRVGCNCGPTLRLCEPTIPGTDGTTTLDVLWDYEEGNVKDTTGTYSFGELSIDPGALSGGWGHVAPADNETSTKMPCAAGQMVHVTADVAAQTLSHLQTRSLNVYWYESDADVNADIASPTAVSGPCSAGAGVIGSIDQTWVVPSGITRFSLHMSHGMYIDNIEVTVTTPGTEAQNPNAGTSKRGARCDHSHDPSDLNIDASDVTYGGSPLDGTLDELVGADNAEVYSFAAAPTTGDDSDDGYAVGDIWIDTSASPNDVYVLTDDTVGSAVWKKLGGGASELDDLSDVDTSTTAPTDGQALVYDSADSTWKPGDVAGGLAVEDSDASVTDSAVTKLVFPDGTLAISSHVATITLPTGAAAASIGDGSATSFAVDHSLGTTDIIVQLWDQSGTDPVEATADATSITATDNDTVTIVFGTAPSADQYRVVVLSRGASGGGTGGGGSLPAAKGWLTDNDDARDYPASADTMDDEFNDASGMSGATNGLAAKWTWRNQGAATATFGTAGWLTISPPASSSDNFRIIEQNLPAGDWAFETHISVGGLRATNIFGGMVVVDGTNGDFYHLGSNWESIPRIRVDRWNSVTSYGTPMFTGNQDDVYHAGYFRIEKSGTTLLFYYSLDGIGWVRLISFTDTVSPTKVGVGCSEKNNSGLTRLHVDYFRRIA